MTGDKYMLKLQWKQERFSYSACGTFTKHPEKIKKFREIELDKTCFAHIIVLCSM